MVSGMPLGGGRQPMITNGSIALPSGQTISAGHGAHYGIGADRYPVTIIGWTASGKTIYYQAAKAHPTADSDHYGEQRSLFTPDPDAPIKAATWRSSKHREGGFCPKGEACGYVSTNGYASHRDPSF
jgi:hypothetical protein